jgi:hypothetical protein
MARKAQSAASMAINERAVDLTDIFINIIDFRPLKFI